MDLAGTGDRGVSVLIPHVAENQELMNQIFHGVFAGEQEEDPDDENDVGALVLRN